MAPQLEEKPEGERALGRVCKTVWRRSKTTARSISFTLLNTEAIPVTKAPSSQGTGGWHCIPGSAAGCKKTLLPRHLLFRDRLLVWMANTATCTQRSECPFLENIPHKELSSLRLWVTPAALCISYRRPLCCLSAASVLHDGCLNFILFYLHLYFFLNHPPSPTLLR